MFLRPEDTSLLSVSVVGAIVKAVAFKELGINN
jgi:hypothetical protein